MGKHNDYGYGVLTNIDVGQVEDSLKTLVSTFNGKCHVNLLEVGTLGGWTSRAVDKKLKELGLKDYSYWAIDNGSYRKSVSPFDGCNFVVANSEEAFLQIPGSLHWVFIDACHCVNHVMLDFLNYGYRVVENGLLLFHDTSPSVQGTQYQGHGPRTQDFCIGTEMAFRKLDIFHRRDWKFVSNKYDESKRYGGVAIFQKTKASEKMLTFYGKEKQDVWVVNMLGQKENGFFVDIGASNGLRHSNSYVFEKDLNWKGICVEPNSHERGFPTLVKNRSCFCERSCIYNRDGIVDFVARARHTETSSIYDKDKISPFVIKLVEKGLPVTPIPCMTLMALLKKYNAPSIIDYISIDTEGAEWEILRDFDFSQYTFLTMTIENNCPTGKESENPTQKDHRDKIRNLLKDHGYIFKIELSHGEDWFVHKSVESIK